MRKLLLLVGVLALVTGTALAQSEDIAATAQQLADAAAVDTPSASAISTGVYNPSRRAPRSGANPPERHPMLTAKPDFTALSAPDLAAAFSGAASAASAPSSEAADSTTGGIAAQANGGAGAAYADSRFGTGTDYASIAKAVLASCG